MIHIPHTLQLVSSQSYNDALARTAGALYRMSRSGSHWSSLCLLPTRSKRFALSPSSRDRLVLLRPLTH